MRYLCFIESYFNICMYKQDIRIIMTFFNKIVKIFDDVSGGQNNRRFCVTRVLFYYSQSTLFQSNVIHVLCYSHSSLFTFRIVYFLRLARSILSTIYNVYIETFSHSIILTLYVIHILRYILLTFYVINFIYYSHLTFLTLHII